MRNPSFWTEHNIIIDESKQNKIGTKSRSAMTLKCVKQTIFCFSILFFSIINEILSKMSLTIDNLQGFMETDDNFTTNFIQFLI